MPPSVPSHSLIRIGQPLALFLLLTHLLALHTCGAENSPATNPSPTKGTFWIIPHTHWEGAVFKTREEYLEEGLSHILTAVRLLREHPDYRFALDQVAYFKPFLERYPEEAGAFRKFVTQGRLQIVGGLDIMPDDNMPSGESFVRQMLYAKGYCREALGVDVKTGWLLDTFGHHAQLPQILHLAGYHSFWFARGVEDRNKMPSEFLWQGIDGTRLPAFWLPFNYAYLSNPPRELARFTDYIQKRYRDLASFSRGAPDRAGFNGEDVSDPNLYLPELVEQFNRQPNMPFTLRFGVPAEYEATTARRTNLEVITGERNPLFQGIYSTRIELKQRMRRAERLLTTAEKFGALANWLGGHVTDQPILRAWEPALFNVTHDLASGVMTDHVYEDVLRGYDFSQTLAEEMIETDLGKITAAIDTRGEGISLVVFNTLGWPRTDVARGDVGFAEDGIQNFDVLDGAGKIVPAQLEEVDRFQDGGLRRIKFAFVARNVPALGYAIYHVVPRQAAGESKAGVIGATGGGATAENDFYRAAFDPATGAMTSLRLKENDWETLAGPANIVASEKDNGDVWELYKTLDGGQHVIMTRPLNVPARGQARFGNDETGKNGAVLRGPVFAEFQVRHPFGSNTFASSVRLYQGIQRVDFETKILNQEKFVRYRLLVPTTVKNGRNFQEIPFGAIERPMAQEFPAQNWIDYSDAAHGMTLVNEGMPGNNVADGTLMLSLIRSTRIQEYGGLDPSNTSDTALELGKELTLRYALIPHTGDWRQAKAYRAGLEFNNPLIVRKTEAHRGSLPGEWGFLEISPANVVLSACKPARDGSTIIRIYEAAGLPTTGATIKMRAKILGANEANLMEDSGTKLKIQKDTVRFDLHPFEIKTLKFQIRSTAGAASL